MKDKKISEKIDLIKKIFKLDPNKSLFIVSCTKEKIWDIMKETDQYYAAEKAYYGKEFKKFLEWYELFNLKVKGYYWIILSGKYGFIEPKHPITWYDINMANPNHYPISLKSLKNQCKQIRKWQLNGKYVNIKLNKFQNFICVNCDPFYIERIKSSLGDKNYIIVDNIEKIIGD
ncbi:MAG: hypothetical protein GF311_25810 [Candidatus Lokiarchaeota archaeon]|nr:hypothetical protein [Candidatus Lokiarchaeota archaeon]